MEQIFLRGRDSSRRLPALLARLGVKKYLLVCGRSFEKLPLKQVLDGCPIPHILFQDFCPNPRYTDVLEGVALFRKAGCDAIVAVGGGSALDVAKCVKLFAPMTGEDYLHRPWQDSPTPLIAVPTTAGTGSESTPFAVIYEKGQKQSVHHAGILPNAVILDHSLLATLPLYQKKCTLMDALCQAMEAWWSVNSTPASRRLSRQAVQGILAHYRDYLSGSGEAAPRQILLAANRAGRAIHITQTTAAHAMSYKLTTLYSLPHGHAVAVCLPHIWQYMADHPAACVDPRGWGHVEAVFRRIAGALGASDVPQAIRRFTALLEELALASPVSPDPEQDLPMLAASVNLQRLKNNPIALDPPTLLALYRRILAPIPTQG